MTASTTIIISSAGIGVILGLSALLVLPMQNQAFAAPTSISRTLLGTLTCADGSELRAYLEIGATVYPSQEGGEVEGRWVIYDFDNLIPVIRGQLDAGTITNSGFFNLRGTVNNDFECSGSSPPYNMHITGDCGSDSEVKFRTEDGEKGIFSGSVECNS
jgi:hypothetical protein